MVTCADSSFLVSIYNVDEHNDRAITYLRENPHPIHLTPFARSETQHALRMLAYRRMISEEKMTRALLTFEQDQEEGFFTPVALDAATLFSKAAQLSQRHALDTGVRYVDLLHVAAALAIEGIRFLTFDERQRKLAKRAGLETKV